MFLLEYSMIFGVVDEIYFIIILGGSLDSGSASRDSGKYNSVPVELNLHDGRSAMMTHDDDISNGEVLQRFLGVCEDIENHAFTANGFKPILRVIPEDDGNRYLLNEPDSLALGDYIPKLRILMSPNELVHVDSIRDLLLDVVVEDALRADLSTLAKEWQVHKLGGTMPIVYNGKDVIPDQAWRLILYGGLLHYDLGKRRRIEALQEKNVLWIFQLKFYQYIDYASNYVLGVGRVAKSAIERDAIDWSRARYRWSKAA